MLKKESIQKCNNMKGTNVLLKPKDTKRLKRKISNVTPSLTTKIIFKKFDKILIAWATRIFKEIIHLEFTLQVTHH